MKPPYVTTVKVVALLAVSMAAALPAQAYIDPGTGSYLFQILFGLIMGIIVLPGAFLRRLMFWRKKKSPKDMHANDQ